jgi:hypothetical protein
MPFARIYWVSFRQSPLSGGDSNCSEDRVEVADVTVKLLLFPGAPNIRASFGWYSPYIVGRLTALETGAER